MSPTARKRAIEQINSALTVTSWECCGDGLIVMRLVAHHQDGGEVYLGSLRGDNGSSWYNDEPWTESLSDKSDSWLLDALAAIHS